MLAVAFAAGCGKSEGPLRVAVEGTVTVDGQPLKAGRIAFIPIAPAKGPAATGAITDGAFEVEAAKGAVVGNQRVEIDGEADPGFAIDDEAAYAKAHTERRGKVLPPNPIPPRYNRRSTLTKTVEADKPNKFEFTLETKATSASR